MANKNDTEDPWIRRYKQRRCQKKLTYNQKQSAKAAIARRERADPNATTPLEVRRPADTDPAIGKRVKLYWWAGMGGRNFGDVLSRYVVRAAIGRPVVHAGSSPRLLAVGSILRLAKSGDLVWGSGLSMPSAIQPHLDIRAVRVPLTRREVIGQNQKCPEVYGDPALLVNRIFDASAVKKDGQVGVLPHYVDQDHAKKLCRRKGVRIIDVLADPEDVIRSICQSSIVYSSSLHGVICAEAMGVPAVWVQFSDDVRGGTFKFRDYYLASGREPPKALNWRDKADPSPDRDAPLVAFPDLDELLSALPGAKNGPLAQRSLRKIRL